MLRRIDVVAVFLIVIAGLAAGQRSRQRFEDRPPRVGEAAPDFTLPTLEGEDVQLDMLCGEKPVLLMVGSCT